MQRMIISFCVYILLVGCVATISKKPSSPFLDQSGETALRARTLSESDRLIISTAWLKIKTAEPDEVQSKVMIMAANFNGYVVNSTNDQTTIRVPAANLQQALLEIELFGEIVEKRISGRDVTEEFKDLDIRIENAEKTRNRYLELLKIAATVSEILPIEKELERLNRELDLLKSKRERLSNMIAFASITVKTVPQLKPGPVGRVFTTLYEGVKWLFIWD